jgi:predicted transcriptional regulator
MGARARSTARQGQDDEPLDRALAQLGPLEGLIMRALWTGSMDQPFVVRDAQSLAPHLAYSTMMTTLSRLAGKGLLAVDHAPGQRAYGYRVAGAPRDFLVRLSRKQAQRMLERYGDAALTAFAAELGDLSSEQLRQLRERADRG